MLNESGFSFVEKSIKILEEIGLKTPGIYRKCGSIKQINEIIDIALDSSGSIQSENVHAITGALKKYVRELEHPLLTNKLYDEFLEATSEYIPTNSAFQILLDRLYKFLFFAERDESTRIEAMRALIHQLPSQNLEMLKTLIKHLNLVSQFSEQNLMNPYNLSIVFGPNFKSHHPDAIFGVTTLNKAIETLIKNYQVIFEIVSSKL